MEAKFKSKIVLSENNREDDPQTPDKKLLKRGRSSEKLIESSENDDPRSSKSVSRRRSERILEKRSKSSENDIFNENLLRDIEEVDDCEMIRKPTKNFFREYPDSQHSNGQDIYSFKTPKKKDGMVSLAVNTPKSASRIVGTPKTLGTPKSSRNILGTLKELDSPGTPKSTRKLIHQINLGTPKTPKSTKDSIQTKTPRHVRSKFQKGLRSKCKDFEEDESAEEDFEDSGDEYKTESSESSDDCDEIDSSDEEDDKKKQFQLSVPKAPQIRTTRRSTRLQQELIFESDNYFGHSKRKNATSNNTLDSLKTPRLQHEELFELLATHEISQSHQKCMRELQSQYESYFSKWLFVLKEGYNIILYGLGSKRNILETLHSTMLANENVVVVNGYFPSITIKDILDDILTGLLETTCKSKNTHEIVDAIEEELNLTPEYHIFLIIHNLDGMMLRNEDAQNTLSRLAHMSNIHLIASIDHINAPHLWDSIQLSNYNFSWWDVTSFLPYTDETSVVENSMLLKNSGSLTISSMKSVLLSLTQNARGIYMIVVENQLASNKNSNYQGMPFKNLYKKCLEKFFVSSDIILRTQLIEFCDHNLLKLKRSPDGTEMLKIPIDNVLLQQFEEQYKTW